MAKNADRMSREEVIKHILDGTAESSDYTPEEVLEKFIFPHCDLETLRIIANEHYTWMFEED